MPAPSILNSAYNGASIVLTLHGHGIAIEQCISGCLLSILSHLERLQSARSCHSMLCKSGATHLEYDHAVILDADSLDA